MSVFIPLCIQMYNIVSLETMLCEASEGANPNSRDKKIINELFYIKLYLL